MLRKFACLVAAATLSACAGGELPENGFVADPYENTNRRFHAFNKTADRYVVNPASKAYDTVTPATVQHMVGNALSHLTLPGLFANHMMQGEWSEAGETLARFTINTVGGAGGLLDPATEFGANYLETDFGLTLEDWGVGPGVYHELPLLGPATTRDAVGKVVGIAFSPTTYIGDPSYLGAAVRGVEVLDTRERYRALIDDLLYESEDSYVTSRSTYIQNRRRLAAGQTEVETLPDIFE